MLSSRPIHLDDGPYFPTKTPGRGLKNRAENAHAGGVAMTVHGKGKNPVAPKTPFQPSSVQPQRLFKDHKTVLATSTRPLGDKTPLPNRHGMTLFKTPLPQKSKLSKLSIFEDSQQDAAEKEVDDNQPPGSIQRPSSLRTHMKHPRISNPKSFQTPMNKGNHWDVSDGDIIVPEAEAMQQEPIAEDEDDFDEVEYGPPNTLDLPYQPPFDFELPDYTEVGKSLRRIAFSVPYYDSPAIPPDPEVLPSDLDIVSWDMVSFPALESDDPFHLARLEAAKPKLDPQTKGRPPLKSSGLAPTRAQPTMINRTRNVAVGYAPHVRGQSPPTVINRSANIAAKTNTVPVPTAGTRPQPRSVVLAKPSALVKPAPRPTAAQSAATKPKSMGQPIAGVQRRPVTQVAAAKTRPPTSAPVRSSASRVASKPSSAIHSKNSSIANTKQLAGAAEAKKSIFKVDEDYLGGDDFMFDV